MFVFVNFRYSYLLPLKKKILPPALDDPTHEDHQESINDDHVPEVGC
jgi:hypothetical protein